MAKIRIEMACGGWRGVIDVPSYDTFSEVSSEDSFAVVSGTSFSLEEVTPYGESSLSGQYPDMRFFRSRDGRRMYAFPFGQVVTA